MIGAVILSSVYVAVGCWLAVKASVEMESTRGGAWWLHFMLDWWKGGKYAVRGLVWIVSGFLMLLGYMFFFTYLGMF
jgi:hypothetical protein